MNNSARIESLELQVVALKIATQKLLKLVYELRKDKIDDPYDNSILYSDMSELKTDLLLESDYIKGYASKVDVDISDMEQHLTDLF